ncbi:MAG TPA: hypothetical protein DEF89_02165 [Desulfosporosinus sp.]|nr:hypothetical protein [Desulfosporosinus sp.]
MNKLKPEKSSGFNLLNWKECTGEMWNFKYKTLVVGLLLKYKSSLLVIRHKRDSSLFNSIIKVNLR